MYKLNKIILGDCIDSMRNIEQQFIDLVVTSPPYNLDIGYDTIDDSIPYNDYLNFTKNWLNEVYRLLKPSGRLCVNFPFEINVGERQAAYVDLVNTARNIGFKYHVTILWYKGHLSRGSAWGSFGSASAPYVLTPCETIIVLYKDVWKKIEKKVDDITNDEFVKWSYGLWNIRTASKKKIGHPAAFPVDLAYRCIKLFSFVNDVVVDPFIGSGSTAMAAIKLKRKWMGMEISKRYVDIANERIKEVKHIEHIKDKVNRYF